MLKKLFALLIVVLMIVPMIASCGDNNNVPDVDNTVNGSEDSKDTDPNAEKNAEIDEYVDELAAQHNFNGKTFTWIGAGDEAPTVDEETGDVYRDALYFRQRDIEEKFGVTWINFTPEAAEGTLIHPIVEAISQSVLAGTHVCDAGYGIPASSVQPLLLNDLLTDMSDFTVLDLDREWWTASLRENYSIAGAIYFLTGAIVSSNYIDTYCVLYNKQVAENYGISGLYDLVKSGDWTFDKMFEVAEVIPANANGSGAYRFANPHGLASLFANGLVITHFDDEGKPYVDEKLSQELSDLADKLTAVFGDETVTASLRYTSGNLRERFSDKYDYDNFDEMFEDDAVLFYFETTSAAASLRTKDVKFGILPMPKRDTAQKDYVSYADSWTGYAVYAPKCTQDTAMTDVILEAMGALGYRYLKPANYDTILKYRTTYDYESQDMIDIIFNAKKYDLVDMLAKDGSWNGDGAYVRCINRALQYSSENFSSAFMMQGKMVNMNIKVILANIEKNNNR